MLGVVPAEGGHRGRDPEPAPLEMGRQKPLDAAIIRLHLSIQTLYRWEQHRCAGVYGDISGIVSWAPTSSCRAETRWTTSLSCGRRWAGNGSAQAGRGASWASAAATDAVDPRPGSTGGGRAGQQAHGAGSLHRTVFGGEAPRAGSKRPSPAIHRGCRAEGYGFHRREPGRRGRQLRPTPTEAGRACAEAMCWLFYLHSLSKHQHVMSRRWQAGSLPPEEGIDPSATRPHR